MSSALATAGLRPGLRLNRSPGRPRRFRPRSLLHFRPCTDEGHAIRRMGRREQDRRRAAGDPAGAGRPAALVRLLRRSDRRPAAAAGRAAGSGRHGQRCPQALSAELQRRTLERARSRFGFGPASRQAGPGAPPGVSRGGQVGFDRARSSGSEIAAAASSPLASQSFDAASSPPAPKRGRSARRRPLCPSLRRLAPRRAARGTGARARARARRGPTTAYTREHSHSPRAMFTRLRPDPVDTAMRGRRGSARRSARRSATRSPSTARPRCRGRPRACAPSLRPRTGSGVPGHCISSFLRSRKPILAPGSGRASGRLLPSGRHEPCRSLLHHNCHRLRQQSPRPPYPVRRSSERMSGSMASNEGDRTRFLTGIDEHP